MGKPAKRVRAIAPQRLNKFIDGSTARSQHLSVSPMLDAVRPPSVYDPSISWDGLSVDPRPFSRFDARPMPGAKTGTHPVGVAGNRVIELDPVNDGSVFTLPTQGDKVRPIPPTAAQIDTTVRGGIDGFDTVVLDEPSFNNYHLHIPQTRPARTPSALLRGGPQADQTLLTPAERKEIMVFEHKQKAAHKLISKADGSKNRLNALMATKHHTGVTGVDSVRNLNSAVYGELGGSIQRKLDRKAASSMARTAALSRIGNAEERLGYNPFHHNTTVLPPSSTQVFQTKNNACKPILNTHERLFVDSGLPLNPSRTQKLRNETLGGKNYNMIQHTLITTLPCSVPFRNNKMQAHPSQASMERGRNMQGFLDLSQVTRCTSPFLPP
ncbi:hypothetical protein TrLO_g8471 [Triparma laevis f. longispina]|uniref:Uncharacterized protein n=1 Tax=Triparma laevis f. longispina TaxID=1714387 RepID=A0A9W7C7H3_9STRA|nr:hypothetical protein TrLO_g8471 [Triparma laevis f. longispina]